jgi:hypothetical protein
VVNYTFFGVVYPERALIELRHPLSFRLENKEFGISGKIRLAIYKSQIIVDFESNEDVADVPTLRNFVRDAAQTVLDIAGMEVAVAYNADIRSVRGPHGQLEVFGPSIPAIGIKNSEHRSVEIHRLFSLAGSDPFLRRALADIRSAISYPVDTGFFCYRAVESLINSTLESLAKRDKRLAISEFRTDAQT